MRILIIGKNGQLGKSISKIASADNLQDNKSVQDEFIFVGRDELNLECPKNVNNYFSNYDFDIIINCAAYTAVDKAEENIELVNRINHLAVEQLANIVNKKRCKLIHVSTDYVFNGVKKTPYLEIDETNPINVYGKTKCAGEQAIKALMPFNAVIIRTSWLYSEYGNNFVKTILNLGKKHQNINVVSDQIGSPTYASDLAYVILKIINRKEFKNKSQPTHIYHYSNKGEVTWYQFAIEIFKLKGIRCKVVPIKTEKFPTLAKRPKNTLMSKSKIITSYNLVIHDWKLSLKKCLKTVKV